MLKQGAVECLFKPFSDTALLQALKCRTSSGLGDLLRAAPGRFKVNLACALGHEILRSKCFFLAWVQGWDLL
jgi:hypothetical protein